MPPQQPPVYGYPQQAAPAYGFPQQGGYGQPGPVYAPPVIASWGARVGAFLLDSLVRSLPLLVGVGIGWAMIMAGRGKCTVDADGYDVCTVPNRGLIFGGLGAIGIGLLAMLGVLIWQLVREGSTGQTIGKKALGIRLVRETDGQPLGFGMAFVRQLAHTVDGMVCYLGYLWPLWDDKGQTFADKIVSSLVIRAQ